MAAFSSIKRNTGKKRYAFTKFVYTVYGLMDILLLYLPYPLMLCNRFLCGALGISSATIRETAVQSYLPENMRARINAFLIWYLRSEVWHSRWQREHWGRSCLIGQPF